MTYFTNEIHFRKLIHFYSFLATHLVFIKNEHFCIDIMFGESNDDDAEYANLNHYFTTFYGTKILATLTYHNDLLLNFLNHLDCVKLVRKA